jgi:penicillin-binding protein 1A
MEGVVERGTGKKVQIVGKPVAGKTGTSNDEKDAWFIGFTPDLTVGVYIGYDTPKPMGKRRTGGELAAPVVADFMRLALRDKPAAPFRVPRGIELIPIEVKTGKRSVFGVGNDGVILEAFKPGDEPPTNAAVIGSVGGTLTGKGAGSGVVLVPAQNGAEPDQGVTPQVGADQQGGGLTNSSNGLY